jgi:SOS response regulatory protein OraA/RecX
VSAPRIEALRTAARDPGRVALIVQGERVGELRRETAEALGAREGAAWTAALERRVREAMQTEACRADALRRLGRRDMTRAMLTERLAARWPAALAERIVAELTTEGWINDRGYAQRRAESLQVRAPLAPEAMQARLEGEGVPASLARSTARAATAATDLDAEVRRLQSRGRGAAAIARALGRGGFDSDTILAALHRAGLECPFPD